MYQWNLYNMTVYAEIGHLKFSPIFADFTADVPDAHF